MKKINSMIILFLSVFFLLLMIALYKYTNLGVIESQQYYLQVNDIYNSYKSSKNSLFMKKDVQWIVQKIINELDLNNLKVTHNDKKILLEIGNLSLQKQDKLLNKILNERFIILKLKVEKNHTMIELGL